MFDLNTKVLVVDDMMAVRRLVRKWLTAIGFTNIEDAADGQLAWTKLNEAPGFGLIVSDWNMPNCSGIDLLRKVRADSGLKGLPFLLLTAEGEPHQIKEAMSLKVDGYVMKPFTQESLQDQLLKAFQKRAA